MNGKQIPNWSVLHVSKQLLELHKDTHVCTVYQSSQYTTLHYKPFQSWGLGTTVTVYGATSGHVGGGEVNSPFYCQAHGVFQNWGPDRQTANHETWQTRTLCMKQSGNRLTWTTLNITLRHTRSYLGFLVILSVIMTLSVTSPNWVKYSLSASLVVSQLRPPTKIFLPTWTQRHEIKLLKHYVTLIKLSKPTCHLPPWLRTVHTLPKGTLSLDEADLFIYRSLKVTLTRWLAGGWCGACAEISRD